MVAKNVINSYKKKDLLLSCHIDDIVRFDKLQMVKGLATSSRTIEVQKLLQFAVTVHKPFNEVTRQDVEQFLTQLSGGNPRGQTINIWKAFLKKFYTMLNGETPDCVAWLKLTRLKVDRKKPSDMLTEDDMEALKKATVSIRDKVIISLLGEIGIRVGELCKCNVGDVVNRGDRLFITVNGKTGVRELELIASAPLMLLYLENHAFKNDRSAPLFISFQTMRHRLGTAGVYSMVKHCGKRAGVTKPVNPHNFRHSRNTDWARMGMPESQQRYLAGWTPSSRMVEIYVHLAPESIHEKRREIETGVPQKVKPRKSKLLPVKCPRCGTDNDSTSKWCRKCWMALDDRSAHRDIKILNTFRSRFVKLLGINVDDVIEEFYDWKHYVTTMSQVHDAFKGGTSIKLWELQTMLGWNKTRFQQIIKVLADSNIVSISGDNVDLVTYSDKDGNVKCVLDNFITLKRRFL